MKKLITIFILAITLSSCTPSMVMDFLKPSSGISVDTEIVAGDKEIHTEVVAEKEINNNTADTINQVFNTVEDKSNWVAIGVATILGWFVGWITKTPIGMFSLFKNAFRRKRNA